MPDKRKIYLIDPKFQIKFSLLLGLFVLLSNVFFSVIIWTKTQHYLSLIEPELVSDFHPETERRRFLLLLAGAQALYALLAALAGFFFSHRIAGPIYKLKKYLGELRSGSPAYGLGFRKGDYFPEVADEVNRTVSHLKGDGRVSGNDKGFSMIGVLAAAGLMGGLALVLAELTKQQMGIQKRLETEVEIISLSNRMVHVLYNGDSCKNTLYADIPAPYRINANDFHTINNIKDKDGDDVFSKGSVYGNRLVKIEDMQLKVPGTVSGSQVVADLEVTFRRESRALTGHRNKLKKFPLTLELDTAHTPPRLKGCVSDASSVAGPVTRAVCTALGGTWIQATGTCQVPGLVAGKRCMTTGQMVTGFDGNGNPLCAAPAPSPFDNFTPCQNGEMVDFTTGGTPRCVPAPSGGGTGYTPPTGCGTGEVLKFDGTSWDCGTDQQGGGGGLSSVPIQDSVKSKDCGDDKILRGFDGNGAPICAQGCPTNEVFTGRFDSTTGDAICVSKHGDLDLTPYVRILQNPPHNHILRQNLVSGIFPYTQLLDSLWKPGPRLRKSQIDTSYEKHNAGPQNRAALLARFPACGIPQIPDPEYRCDWFNPKTVNSNRFYELWCRCP